MRSYTTTAPKRDRRLFVKLAGDELERLRADARLERRTVSELARRRLLREEDAHARPQP